MSKKMDYRELFTLQIAAGIALLRKSRLVDWNEDEGRFTTEFEDPFEQAAAAEDRLFGRLMKWMQFSAGFEFLVKAVLLLKGAWKLGEKEVLVVPATADATSRAWWALIRARAGQKVEQESFGTLGSLTCLPKKGTQVSVLEKFLKGQETKFHAAKEDCDRVYAACELLRNAIRNRDAHAYVPNVRKQQHELIELFVPALNTLLGWVDDDRLLRSHRMLAANIIVSYSDDPYTLRAVKAELEALAVGGVGSVDLDGLRPT